MKGKAGLILTAIGLVGFGVALWLTAKKAPEAQKRKEEALEKKRLETGDPEAQLTAAESLKAQVGCYAPVAAVALATAGSLVGGQIVPQKALKDLEKLHDTYRQVTRKLGGPKAEEIANDITQKKLSGKDGKKLEHFVLRYGGGEEASMMTTLIDIMEAEYNCNWFFTGTGGLTMNQMLEFFHQESVEDGDRMGWDVYLGEAYYGYCWIDFRHTDGMVNGKPVIFIDLPFDCHPLTEEECEEEGFEAEKIIEPGYSCAITE